MTSETKHFIDFGDIIGVELACQNCQTTVTHTLEKFSSAAYQCPNCRSQIIAQQQTDDQTLTNFIYYLRNVQGLKAPARIRLQVRQ